MNLRISEIKTAVDARYGVPSLVLEYRNKRTVAVVCKTTKIRVPQRRMVSIFSSRKLGLLDRFSVFMALEKLKWLQNFHSYLVDNVRLKLRLFVFLQNEINCGLRKVGSTKLYDVRVGSGQCFNTTPIQVVMSSFLVFLLFFKC